MTEKKFYNLASQTFTRSQTFIQDRLCNGFTVLNNGDTICFINDVPLFPSATPLTVAGDSISIGGNENELYKGNITIKFQQPLGATPSVVLIQKFFVEKEKS